MDVGRRGGPILLSFPPALPPPVESYLRANAESIGEAFLYGGTAAVDQVVEDAVGAAIAG